MTTLKRVRTTQPQGPVKIASGNPITQAMVSAILPSGKLAIDYVTGRITSSVGYTQAESAVSVATPYGAGITFNGGSYAREAVFGQTRTQEPDLTSLVLFVPTNSVMSCIMHLVSGLSYEQPSAISLVTGGMVEAVQGQDTVTGKITHQNSSVANKLNCAIYRNKHKVGNASQDLWLNGVKSNTVTNSSAQLTYFASSVKFGSNTAPVNAVTFLLVVTWNRILSDVEVTSLSANPWQIFAPISQPIFVDTVAEVISITRPSSDVSTSGWTGTPDNTNLYTNINETVASDTSYITSPIISGVHECIEGISPTLDAGTWDITYRANFVGASAQVRVSLLDAANTPQGVSDWQTVTSTFATYTAVVVTTGAAVRVKIEVQ